MCGEEYNINILQKVFYTSQNMWNCRQYIISNNIASNITLLWYPTCSKFYGKDIRQQPECKTNKPKEEKV